MRNPEGVRTTDDGLLQVAKDFAVQRGKTARQVHSEQAQQTLKAKGRSRLRNGVPLFQPQPGTKKPSMTLVNQLRDAS